MVEIPIAVTLLTKSAIGVYSDARVMFSSTTINHLLLFYLHRLQDSDLMMMVTHRSIGSKLSLVSFTIYFLNGMETRRKIKGEGVLDGNQGKCINLIGSHRRVFPRSNGPNSHL